MMGKTISYITQLSFLNVLFDWVQLVLGGDLKQSIKISVREYSTHTIAPITHCIHLILLLDTSIFALVQRGTSTTMLKTLGAALNGMSWNGEIGPVSFPIK